MHNKHRNPLVNDPLLRMSRKLQAKLVRTPPPVPTAAAGAVEELVSVQRQLEKLWRLYQTAHRRGWSLAAQRLASRLPPTVGRQREALAVAHAGLAHRPPWLSPSIGDLRQELLALQSEFGRLKLDLKQGIVAVVTESIVLEEIDLGPFQIELHVDRLHETRLASAITCVALEPNPPTCSTSTTHPHVRDDVPCLGEASAAVTAALRDGRLLDAFLAVTSVLQTYNGSSPYVALEDWHGRSCDDCNRHRSEEEFSSCESCHGSFCDGCSTICDSCDGSFCLSCVDRSADDENLCSGCRGACSSCNDITARSVLREYDGRCRSCAESDEEAEEAHGDNDHEGGVESTDVAAVADDAGAAGAGAAVATTAVDEPPAGVSMHPVPVHL